MNKKSRSTQARRLCQQQTGYMVEFLLVYEESMRQDVEDLFFPFYFQTIH